MGAGMIAVLPLGMLSDYPKISLVRIYTSKMETGAVNMCYHLVLNHDRQGANRTWQTLQVFILYVFQLVILLQHYK